MITKIGLIVILRIFQKSSLTMLNIKLLSTLLITIFFLAACSSSQENGGPLSIKATPETEVIDATEGATEHPPEVVPNDIDFYEIAFDKANTWLTIHQYYQNELPKHEGAPYYSNLQNTILFHLLSSDSFYEDADPATIETYVQEILGISFFNAPDLTARCLTALSGYWTENQIESAATKAYGETLSYIENHFDEEAQARILERKQESLEKLKALTSLEKL